MPCSLSSGQGCVWNFLSKSRCAKMKFSSSVSKPVAASLAILAQVFNTCCARTKARLKLTAFLEKSHPPAFCRDIGTGATSVSLAAAPRRGTKALPAAAFGSGSTFTSSSLLALVFCDALFLLLSAALLFQIECQKISQIECQKISQIKCQKIRQIESQIE